MRRNNLFAKFIITFTLVAFLTMSVGKVQRTYALATTATIVGEVLLGLGVTYLAYQTLTGANVYVPGYDSEGMRDYIRGLGETFSKSYSGSRLFSDLYNSLVTDNTYSVMDFTVDRLQDIYNDHKSIAQLQDDSSFQIELDIVPPSTAFGYTFNFIPLGQNLYQNGYITTVSANYPYWSYGDGARFITTDGTDAVMNYLWGDDILRNVLHQNGTYGLEHFVDGVWSPLNSVDICIHTFYSNGNLRSRLKPIGLQVYQDTSNYWFSVSQSNGYPFLADAPIYVEATGEIIPVETPSSTQLVNSPQYPQNDDGDNKFPLVPFVELPSTLKWGFNWRDALTDLVNGGSRLITSAWLADLINDFKSSLSGSGDDISYNYYNEGDNYYFTYYSDVVNDIYNPVYNINIEEQENVIPVDLNTIQQYTDNQYLDVVKERVNAFSDTVGSFVAFWHNTDYEIVYAVFGSALIVLIGAFIGKWGHS